jgi:hypothetical protein
LKHEAHIAQEISDEEIATIAHYVAHVLRITPHIKRARLSAQP